MENSEIDLDLITLDGIDRLLRFLPIFTQPDTVFGTALKAVKTEEFARAANLKHLVMLITAHLRQDHFQNDHLYHKLQDGTIQIIQERLAELRFEVTRGQESP